MVSESIQPVSAQSQTYPSNTEAEMAKDHSNAHYGGEGSSTSVKNDVCYGSSSLSGIDEMTFRRITPDHNSGDSVEIVCAQSNGYYTKSYGLTAEGINNYHWIAWYKKRENADIDKSLANGNYKGFSKAYVQRLKAYEPQIRRINDGKFPELKDYFYPTDTSTGKLDFWVHKPGYYDLYGNPRYASITLDAYQEFTYTVEIGTHHVGCNYSGTPSVDKEEDTTHKKDGHTPAPKPSENWGYCGWASCVRPDGSTCSTGGVPGNASSPDAACGPKPSNTTNPTPNPNNSSSAYHPGFSVLQASGRLDQTKISLGAKKTSGTSSKGGSTSGRDNPGKIDRDTNKKRPSSGSSGKADTGPKCIPYDYWTYEYFTETKSVKVVSTNIINNMYASAIKDLGNYALVLSGDRNGNGYTWERQDSGFITYNPYNHLEIKDKWFENMADNYICVPSADDTCEPGTETTEPDNQNDPDGGENGGNGGDDGGEPVDTPDPDGNDDDGLPPSVIIEIDITEDNPQKKGDYDKFVHLNENVKKRRNY